MILKERDVSVAVIPLVMLPCEERRGFLMKKKSKCRQIRSRIVSSQSNVSAM